MTGAKEEVRGRWNKGWKSAWRGRGWMEGSMTHQILYSADHWSFSASAYYKTGVPYDFKHSQTKSQQWSPNRHISHFFSQCAPNWWFLLLLSWFHSDTNRMGASQFVVGWVLWYLASQPRGRGEHAQTTLPDACPSSLGFLKPLSEGRSFADTPENLPLRHSPMMADLILPKC